MKDITVRLESIEIRNFKNVAYGALNFTNPRRACSASILGLMYDTDCQVQLLMERSVHDGAFFGCHPCENTASLRLRTEDLLQVFLPRVRHTVTVVDL